MSAGVKPLSSTSLGSQPCPDRNLCPFPSDFNLSFQSNTIFSPYFPHSQQSPLVLRGKVTLKEKACVALFSHEFTPSTHLHTQLRRKFSSNSTSIFPPLFQTLSALSIYVSIFIYVSCTTLALPSQWLLCSRAWVLVANFGALVLHYSLS